MEALAETLTGDGYTPEIRALVSRHFVTGRDDLSFGTMHRLVADFLRSLTGDTAQLVLLQACVALQRAMQSTTPDARWASIPLPVVTLYRPHAEALFERGFAIDIMAFASREMGQAAGLLASAQGDHAGARSIGERVLELSARAMGEENPYTLDSMSVLVQILLAQGDHSRARTPAGNALHWELRTRVLGAEHPDTLAGMGNLASAIKAQGDRAGAGKIRGAVGGGDDPRVLGEDHRDTLTAMGNLASTLRMQGSLSLARSLEERVLAIRMRGAGRRTPRHAGSDGKSGVGRSASKAITLERGRSTSVCWR